MGREIERKEEVGEKRGGGGRGEVDRLRGRWCVKWSLCPMKFLVGRRAVSAVCVLPSSHSVWMAQWYAAPPQTGR